MERVDFEYLVSAIGVFVSANLLSRTEASAISDLAAAVAPFLSFVIVAYVTKNYGEQRTSLKMSSEQA